MGNAIKFSAAASLALHATAVMAGARGERVSTTQIAERLGVSEFHLSKVLQQLAKAGLVRATRGPTGGYRLTRPPSQLTVKEIYEALEGKLDIQHCLFGAPVCGKDECPLGSFLERLSQEMRKGLGKMTIADIRVPPRESATESGT
jgi:Rrf2 family protein